MPIKFAVKSRLNVYMTIASAMTLTVTQGHKCIQNLTTFNLQYLRQYLSHCIQTSPDSRPTQGIYAHACFEDLDLDARS